MPIACGLRRGIENGLRSPLGLLLSLLGAVEDTDSRVEAHSETV